MATSVEFRTLLVLTPDLQLAVKADLLHLGAKLMAKGVITSDKYEELKNYHISPANRAADLVQLVQDKVQQNAQHYYTLTDAFESDRGQYGDILEKLQQTYKKISSHSTGNYVMLHVYI